MSVSLERLRVLDTVVRHGSFLAAAKVLHQTQPAISHTIKRLEEECGITIFSRRGLRPVLTDRGRLLHARVVDLLRREEVFNADVRLIAAGRESVLHLAVGAIVPIRAAAWHMRAFIRQNAATQISITVENIGESIGRILKGSIDVAITPFVADPTGYIESTVLAQVTLIPVMASGLFRGERMDLTLYPQIILTSHDESSRGADFGRLPGGRQWVVNDLLAKYELILAGMGWGGLPQHLIENDLKSGRLHEIRKGPVKRHRFDICLLRDRRRLHGPVATSLWEHLKKFNAVAPRAALGFRQSKRR